MELALRQLTPADCEAWLKAFIGDYRAAHPEYRPPEKSDHPAVIVISLQNPLVCELGDIVTYWAVVMTAVQHWFEPGEDAYAFRAIKAVFNSSCGLAADSDAAEGMNRVWHDLKRWEAGGQAS